MKKDREPKSCIQAVPIFKNLSQTELDEIIQISTHKVYQKGEFLYTAGDQLESLFVIHQGSIKILRTTEDGKEQVLRILKSGDFLGELSLFNEANASTDAQMLESTVVCFVERNRLKKLLSQSPTLSFKMMNELSNRLEKAEALIEHSNLYPAIAKVGKLLLELAKNQLVVFDTTKSNLSSSLGITPETFSRKLKELERLQVIQILNHKSIRILNPDALEELINPPSI